MGTAVREYLTRYGPPASAPDDPVQSYLAKYRPVSALPIQPVPGPGMAPPRVPLEVLTRPTVADATAAPRPVATERRVAPDQPLRPTIAQPDVTTVAQPAVGDLFAGESALMNPDRREQQAAEGQARRRQTLQETAHGLAEIGLRMYPGVNTVFSVAEGDVPGTLLNAALEGPILASVARGGRRAARVAETAPATPARRLTDLSPAELVDRLPDEFQTSRGSFGYTGPERRAPPPVAASPSELVDQLPRDLQTSRGLRTDEPIRTPLPDMPLAASAPDPVAVAPRVVDESILAQPAKGRRKPLAKQTNEELALYLRDTEELLQNERVQPAQWARMNAYGEMQSPAGGGLGGHILEQARERAEKITAELERRGLSTDDVFALVDDLTEREAIRDVERGVTAPRSGGSAFNSGVPFSGRGLGNERGALGGGGDERIVAAAVRSEATGKVYIGANHADAWVQARESGETVTSTEDLFQTSTGRIVDRSEAYRIADKRGQIDRDPVHERAAKQFFGSRQRVLHARDLLPDEKIGGGELGARLPDIRGESGGGATKYLTGLTGAGLGGTAGAATIEPDDSPAERAAKIAAGAVLGTVAGGAVGHGLERLGAKAGRAAQLGTDVSAIAETIAAPGTATKPTGLLTGAERIYRDVVNESIPLERLGQVLGQSDALKNLVSQSRGWRGMASQFLADHLRPVLTTVKGKEAEVAALAKAQRALQILDQGGANKVGVPRDVIERAAATLTADPEVAAGAKQLQDYYRGLLTLRRDEGILTDDAYQAIVQSEDFYTPFAREFDDAVTGAGGGKLLNRGTGVARMDRTAAATSKTRDPFQMAVLHTAETWRQVAKQRVTNMVSDLVEADPEAASAFLREIPNPAAARHGRAVQANVQGVRKTYEVLDPDLYDAWAAFDPPTKNIVVALLRPFKSLLQTTVTALPDFAVANAIRDNTMASVQRRLPLLRAGVGTAAGAGVGAATAEPGHRTEGAVVGGLVGLGASQIIPNLARSLGMMRRVLKNDPLYQQFLRDGGDTFGFFPRNTDDAAKVLANLRKTGVSASDVVNPRQWWHGLQALNRAVEQGPRLQTYAEGAAAGLDVPARIQASRDISLDFSRIGAKTKGIAATTAFWNAKVQGWDKLARMLKNPKTYAVGAASITAPTVALWLHNKDNPAYWERPQWERNMFWLVPKGEGQFWRVPKPFELGFIFGSVPERTLDYLHQRAVGGDPQAAETLGSALRDMLSTTGEGTLPIPTGAELLIEQLANYDFFRNRPIVTRPDVPASVQYTDRTASAPYVAGQATGMSPERIEHVVRSATGTVGRLALDAGDAALRATGADTRPQTQDVRTPMLSRFVTREGQMSDQEMALRRRAGEAEAILRGARKVYGEGNAQAITTYRQRYGDQLRITETRRGPQIELTPDAERLRQAIKELDRDREHIRELRAGGAAENHAAIRYLEQKIAQRAQALSTGAAPVTGRRTRHGRQAPSSRKALDALGGQP